MCAVELYTFVYLVYVWGDEIIVCLCSIGCNQYVIYGAYKPMYYDTSHPLQSTDQ